MRDNMHWILFSWNDRNSLEEQALLITPNPALLQDLEIFMPILSFGECSKEAYMCH